MKNKSSIIVKATFMHKAGKDLYQKLEEGKKVEKDVTFVNTGAFIEAQIDGAAIGNVVTPDFDIPKLYTATLEGKGDESMTFIVSVEEGASGTSEYEAEKADAVSKGFSAEDVDERIRYMTEEGFHPSVIKAAISFLASYGDPENAIKIGPNDPVYRRTADDSPIQEMVKAAYTQSALILFGEKSTGKNVASHTVAWLLGQPEYRIGFQRDMGIDDAFGGKGTDNSAAEALDEELATAYVLYNADPRANANYASDAGKFELLKAQAASIRVVQNKSALLKWAAEGGVMMFDEVNMAHANLLQAIMNPLCDGDKTLVVPGYGRIRIHPACVLFAGMNPGYAGTMELNDATASRCGFYEFTLPESIKAVLGENFSGPSKALLKRHIDACNRLYQDFRAAVTQGRISNKCLNIRGFVNALKQVEIFPEASSLSREIQVYVINACPSDERIVLNSMLRDKITF